MQRLITSLAMIIAVAAAATPAFAQSRDLAGSWVLDAEKSGTKDGPPMVVLTLTAKEFTARLGGETARLMTFKLDGTETTLADGAGKTKAEWKGNKLDATVTIETGPQTATFSRDGVWLVMEGNSPQRGQVKLYYRKAPAKY